MLRDRLLTAVLIGAVLLAVLFLLPPWAAMSVMSAAALLGAWEWSRLLVGWGAVPRLSLVLALGALLLWWWWLPLSADAVRAVLLLASLWWLLALFWVMLAPTRGSNVTTYLACLLSLAPLWLAVSELRGGDLQGARILLFALLVIVAADTGAYFAGRRFGRLKLAPQVSPGKTWEGVFGGLILATVVGVVGAQWLGWTPLQILPLVLTAAAVSIVGDLLESKMKRQAGVKDSGQLIPGHGGVLDRLDSLAAGLPVMTLGLGSLGLLA